MVEPIRIKDQFSLISGTKSIQDDTNIVADDDDGGDDSDIADPDDDEEDPDDPEAVGDYEVVDEVDDDDEGQLVLDLEVDSGSSSPRKRKFLDPSSESGSPSHTKHPFKYVCPFCGKRYTSRSGLLSHKNTVHYQRKPYRCQLCNEHFFTSAQRVAHIHKEHADKGEDITDTYSRKDTVMRKKASAGAAEEDAEEEEPPRKTTPVVPLLPKSLPPPQDIRYYKMPSSHVEGLQVQKAYSLVASDKKYSRNPAQEHEIITAREIIPQPKSKPPQLKFVVLPAKQPYAIVQKPRESSGSSPNKTYSRKDQQENSRPSLTQIITMKKPAAAAPIKIVINQTKGISQVISNSSSSSSSKKVETEQPQRSDSASSSATVPLEPQVVLEEGGRAVAQWKKRSSDEQETKDPSEVEMGRVGEPATIGGRRLLQEKSALPRDFGLAHDHDKSLPPDAVSDLEYKCMECVKSFATSNDLLAHLVCHRPSDRPPSSGVKCALCQVRVEPAELANHLIKKHVNAKSKKLSVSLDAALKSSGEVLCDICGKVLSNNRWKRIHMKYHHPGEEDEDEDGGGGTRADFTHECGTCAGLFDSATDLYNHRAYHCSVSLRCSHCTEIFGSVASLLKHCRLNHREKGEHLRFVPKRASSSEATPVDPIATKKGMRCPMCDHVSRESEEFGWHVSKAHGVRSIKCVNCDFVGAHFQEVVRHMRESHGVEVGQGICLVNKAVPIRA